MKEDFVNFENEEQKKSWKNNYIDYIKKKNIK